MRLIERVEVVTALARGFASPFERPDRLPRALLSMAPWGASVAGLAAGGATRYPDRVAVDDEQRSVTYRELWQRSLALAAGLADQGVGPGSRVGLLCRNHVGFVENLIGAAATGADVVLLNTGFAAPQLADVVASEAISLVLHDDELEPVARECGATTIAETEQDRLAGGTGRVRPTRRAGSLVILTSGTTGRPKGAARKGDTRSIEGLASLVDAIPLRLGDVQVVAAPLFHAWGLSHLLLGLARCATTVLSRRFDATRTLRQVAEHRASVLVVVPVMLSRMLKIAERSAGPMPDLRVIASSGSALGPRLATEVQQQFGGVLYNLYGSTEVAVASVAGPDDLMRAPGAAGRPALGVRVEILDAHGDPVPDGKVGRIFVGGAMRFDGYTDGGRKEMHRGLVATGDLGRFDEGLLFVDGREDDMIVSGGENVFPIEVEDVLREHPAVDDVAVVGISDAEFGQGLAAFVVKRTGARLSVEQVRSHVRDQLARHKVPRKVVFVDDLPRNPAGKLLRKALTDL